MLKIGHLPEDQDTNHVSTTAREQKKKNNVRAGFFGCIATVGASFDSMLVQWKSGTARERRVLIESDWIAYMIQRVVTCSLFGERRLGWDPLGSGVGAIAVSLYLSKAIKVVYASYADVLLCQDGAALIE